MKRLLLYVLCLLAVFPVFSQQADAKLSASDAVRCLTDGEMLTIPMGDGGEVTSLWVERISSLTSSEGIRTFVARSGADLLGTLSIARQRISGWVMYNGHSWRVDTDADACLTVSREDCHECDGHCVEATDDMPAEPIISRSAAGRQGSSWSDRLNEDIVYNDAILYIYRLAMPVDWSVFSSSIFGGDVSRVKTFWANMEVSLNEIYGREVGVFFTIVNDDRLIRDSAEKQLYTTTNGPQIIGQNTEVVNSIIGKDSYDVAYTVANITTSLGVTYLYSAYRDTKKGASTGDYALRTIAHEIGHMFGAQHTFTEGGYSTIETEPGMGQSLMSYGMRAGNYFSLPSIRQMRSTLSRYLPYFSYPDRTEKFNADRESAYTNIVCGIPTDNRQPVIDTLKLKRKYRIPKNTYFGFHIDAFDPDGDDLLYMAHQADFSGAAFVSDAPSAVPDITFQPKWIRIFTDGMWKFVMDDYTDPTSTGTFHFWLGVLDGRMPESTTDPTLNPHAMCYDAYETEVEVADGTPFRFYGTILRDYTAGQRLTLTWNVDRSIFGADSRVRILLSDDFGQTWKYVLKESAPNNGRCEVILPQLSFNYVSIGGSRKEIRAGVIKVEEIGGIAYALTATDPIYDQTDGSQTYSGGFRLNKSDVVFSGTPERYIVVSESEIPPVADVTATCKGVLLDVSFTESRDGNVITRVWEAVNPSGIRYAFEQIICVRDSEPDAGVVDIPASESRWNVYVAGRTIIIENVSGLSVDLFDLQGRRLFSRRDTTTDTEQINIPASGIYIVRVGGEACRIVVR